MRSLLFVSLFLILPSGESAADELAACLAKCEENVKIHKSPSLVKPCQYGCYETKALQTRKAEDCDAALDLEGITKSSSYYGMCLEKIAAATQDPLVCLRGERFSGECLNKALGDRKDPSVCAKMNKPEAQTLCYKKVAFNSRDPSICTRIPDQFWINGCISSVAKQVEDPAVCKQIKDENFSLDCLQMLAVKARKPEICESIPNQDRVGKCLMDIAHWSKNPALCRRISEKTPWRRQCEEMAGKR